MCKKVGAVEIEQKTRRRVLRMSTVPVENFTLTRVLSGFYFLLPRSRASVKSDYIERVVPFGFTNLRCRRCPQVMFFSTKIFEMAQLSPDGAKYATLGMGTLNVIMTLVSLFLVEVFGRKTLLLVGFSAMFIDTVLLTIALMFAVSICVVIDVPSSGQKRVLFSKGCVRRQRSMVQRGQWFSLKR